MIDDVPAILQEIMELGGYKTQTALARRCEVAQSTINRWLQRQNLPNIEDWDRVRGIWRELKGLKLTIDEKIRPYGPRAEAIAHEMVDEFLSRLPPPHK